MAKKENNYYYEIVSANRARELHKSGFEIYKLFPDTDQDSKIENTHDLEDSIDLGIELALKKLIK